VVHFGVVIFYDETDGLVVGFDVLEVDVSEGLDWLDGGGFVPDGV